MSALDSLVDANHRYASDFTLGDLSMPPGRKLAVVTCMDARIETGRALGLAEGDAHVIRNAGGRVVEALRSLAISQQLLGTEAVAIIHHSDCGMLTFKDDDIRARIRENLGADADHVAFLPFSEVEESVRADLSVYGQSPLVRHDIPVRGFVFDVRTGGLSEVH